MNKHKFKIGDKVLIKVNSSIPSRYHNTYGYIHQLLKYAKSTLYKIRSENLKIANLYLYEDEMTLVMEEPKNYNIKTSLL